MYPALLTIHNIMRWIVVILAVVALVRAYTGWLGRRGWLPVDRRIGMLFSISMDIQLLLGLILYFLLSPLTRQFLQDMGASMSIPELRFFGLEHLLYMLVAVVLVHIGSARSRKAQDPVDKHRQAAIWFSFAVIVILLGMPWMRPLLRL